MLNNIIAVPAAIFMWWLVCAVVKSNHLQNMGIVRVLEPKENIYSERLPKNLHLWKLLWCVWWQAETFM